jgi:uncharacterized protein
MDPAFEPSIEDIMNDPDGFDFSLYPLALAEMLQNRVLVDPGDEESFMEIMRFEKRAACFDPTTLGLTVLVTEDCNFGCPYCYEQHKQSCDMSQKVQEQLLQFISFMGRFRQINVTWFGGEPLMRFDTILSLTERLMAMDCDFSAMMVTNGWLLDCHIADQLEQLCIKAIQVTIEGPPHVHNQKRFHLEHGDSFEKIQSNLDYLMFKSNWTGKLLIHFNIDSANAEHYETTRKYWVDRYPGRVVFGINFVDRDQRGSRDMGCCLDREQEIDFYINEYHTNGGEGLSYFPKRHSGMCSATMRNAFVIGAKGQVYKCWHDVGRKDREIGSLFELPQKWNWSLIAQYMTGVDILDDPECCDCFLQPVCDECPMIRYRKKYEGQNISVCARYSDRLAEFLEIHHARKLKQ